MSDAELAALVVLVGLPELGPRRLRRLLAHLTPVDALAAIGTGRVGALPATLMDGRRIDDATIAAWASAVTGVDPAAVLERHRRAGVSVMGPAELRLMPPWEHDPEPPVVLFCSGRFLDPYQPTVGIVGTRRCTAYGRGVARSLGAALARAGVTVVSGVALGIDGAAQTAALDAGGVVVGVVASGLDRPYPPGNTGLWKSLAEVGSLISEYPLGAEPRPWRFPARNRLIAAIADVLVVVESPAEGGSMYTVEAALERGRTVMAVPGPVTSRASSGTNQLVADGALMVRSADDVIAALGVLGPPPTGLAPVDHHEEPEADEELLHAFGWEPCTVDGLVERSGREPAWVAAALTRLALRGVVGSTSGWWERLR